MQLLAAHSAIPEDSRELVAAALCRSLAPNTLARYLEVVRAAERGYGTPFTSWLPFSEEFIQGYVLRLLERKLTASTINQHISALGTFAAWVNHARPRSEMVAYILKGESKQSGPPEKVRVHKFPFRDTMARVDCVRGTPDLDRVALLYLCTVMLLLRWPVRPVSLHSCRTDNVYL